MSKGNRDKVVAALAEVAKFEGRAAVVASREFPVGSEIRWERSRGIQHGTIEAVSYHHGPRFRIYNPSTKKTYWIDFYDVLRAAGEQESNAYLDRLNEARTLPDKRTEAEK